MCACLNCCVKNKPTPHINSVKCHGVVHALFKLHELRSIGMYQAPYSRTQSYIKVYDLFKEIWYVI